MATWRTSSVTVPLFPSRRRKQMRLFPVKFATLGRLMRPQDTAPEWTFSSLMTFKRYMIRVANRKFDCCLSAASLPAMIVDVTPRRISGKHASPLPEFADNKQPHCEDQINRRQRTAHNSLQESLKVVFPRSWPCRFTGRRQQLRHNDTAATTSPLPSIAENHQWCLSWPVG